MAADVMDEQTGAAQPLAADEIRGIRERIDEIDQAIIDLWLERANLSQQVGRSYLSVRDPDQLHKGAFIAPKN